MQVVEQGVRPVAAEPAAPLEGTERVVHAEAHRRVDVLLGGHSLGDRVVREVDHPGDRAGDDHAGDVADDADVLAERLEEAGGLGEGLRRGVLGGGQRDPGGPAVVDGEVEVDDVPELHRRLAVGERELAAAGQHQGGCRGPRPPRGPECPPRGSA